MKPDEKKSGEIPVTRVDIPVQTDNRDINALIAEAADCLEQKDPGRLIDSLKKRLGSLPAITNDVRESISAELNIDLRNIALPQSFEILKRSVLNKIKRGQADEALKIMLYYRGLVMRKVESLMQKKYYLDAMTFLSDLHNSSRINEKEWDLQSDIDAEITYGLDNRTKTSYLEEKVDNLVYRGYYIEAAAVCRALEDRFAREKIDSHEKETVAPAQTRREKPKIPETGEVKRHREELYASLPAEKEKLHVVFEDFGSLFAEYLRVAKEHREDIHMLEALKGFFQIRVEELFEQNKISFSEAGGLKAEESLLRLISELKELGFNLYRNKKSATAKTVRLMMKDEINNDFIPLNVDLDAEDITLDPENFDEHAPDTVVMGKKKEENTSVTYATSYTWKNRAINLTPEGSAKLRKAA